MTNDSLPFIAVLLAGGGGTRLWPISRPDRPKQLLPLFGGKSLLEISCERIAPVFTPDRIFFSTTQAMLPHIQSRLPNVAIDHLLCEPASRNTAPAIAFTLLTLKRLFGPCIMACLPADHFILHREPFQAQLIAACSLAQEGYLVTLGIPPDRPDTGYGYIEQGASIDESAASGAFWVRRFKEKPDPEEAVQLVERGGYFWNAGMFFWRSDILEAEFSRQQPAMLETVNTILAMPSDDPGRMALWETLPSLSIDYGILEHAERVAMLPAPNLGWTDVGSWDALADLYHQHPDLRGPVSGRDLDFDSKGITIVRSAGSNRNIATIGLEDLLIVDAEDGILICRKGESQKVRGIAEQMQRKTGPPARLDSSGR